MIYSLEHIEIVLSIEEREKFTKLLKRFRLYDKIDIIIELCKSQK